MKTEEGSCHSACSSWTTLCHSTTRRRPYLGDSHEGLGITLRIDDIRHPQFTNVADSFRERATCHRRHRQFASHTDSFHTAPRKPTMLRPSSQGVGLMPISSQTRHSNRDNKSSQVVFHASYQTDRKPHSAFDGSLSALFSTGVPSDFDPR